MEILKMKLPLRIEECIWDNNEFFRKVNPFDKIYAKWGRGDSSLFMYSLWVYLSPSSYNSVRNGTEEVKRKVAKKIFKDFDPEEPLIKDAINAYVDLCVGEDERNFYNEKATLISRTNQIIKLQEAINIAIEDPLLFESEKKVKNLKELTSLLETMRKNTVAVYNQYNDAESKFMNSEEKDAILFGGGKLGSKQSGQLKLIGEDEER